MRRLGPLFLVGALLLAGCGGTDRLLVDDSSKAPADFNYTIPVGAAEAFKAGQPLDILPPVLEAKVGQVLQIVNEDVAGHQIGPFYVGAGETLRQRFSSTGTFVGTCTVHPNGEIMVLVKE
jgi:plastocyanin